MPKGPKGQKRPADTVANAIKVAKIATGEEEFDKTDDGKDRAAQSLGRRGGKARAAKLSQKERSAIARAAAKKRWLKERD
ncbi:MAG: RNA-binding protein [Hyphomicrobiaceae bacterium]